MLRQATQDSQPEEYSAVDKRTLNLSQKESFAEELKQWEEDRSIQVLVTVDNAMCIDELDTRDPSVCQPQVLGCFGIDEEG